MKFKHYSRGRENHEISYTDNYLTNQLDYKFENMLRCSLGAIINYYIIRVKLRKIENAEN